jgi:hypothetical protein
MTTPQPEPARGNDGSSAPDGFLSGIPQQIGQAVAAAVAQVLQQVPMRVQQLKCATCVLARAQWAAAHAADIKAAGERMAEALAAFPPDHPIRQQADLVAFLPPHLHPGAGPESMPPVQDGAVMTAGTIVCPAHIPGIPQAGGGRREFLIANGSLSATMLAEMARR